MRDYHDDHSGDDENVDSEQPPLPGDRSMYPESPLHDDPIYHSPTQPVEPVYPVPGDVDEPVNVDSDEEDESLLDKVKRWVTGESASDSD